MENRKSSGRSRTVRTPEKIKIRERIRRNPTRSARKLAKETNTSRSTIQRILHEDGLRPFKKRKVHGLTDAQKKKRYERSGTLLAWHENDEIIFSDEKIFLLEEPFNPQQHRVWAVSLHDIPANKLQVERFQNVTSVMVWICKRGKLPLVFIEDGAKVNQKYYLDKILKAHLLPEAQKLFGTDYFCFQQDGATSHTAKTVQHVKQIYRTSFQKMNGQAQRFKPFGLLHMVIYAGETQHQKNNNKKEFYKRYGTKFHWMSSVPLAIVLKNVCVYYEKPKVIDSNSIHKM